MSLKHGLMGLLSQKPMTGYDLDKEFNASLGYFWPAQYSQIYAELDKMEKKGWLVSQRVVQEDKPNKRVYSMTAEGNVEFLDWLSTPETDMKNSFSVKSAFLMRLFFAESASKAQTLDMLHTFNEVCNARKVQYDKAKDSIVEDGDGKYVELTLMYGEMMNQARIAWVKEAIATVENMEEN